MKGRSVQAFITSQPNQHNPQGASNQPESTTDRPSDITPFDSHQTLSGIAQEAAYSLQEYQGLSSAIVGNVDEALARITNETLQAIDTAPERGLRMLAAGLANRPKRSAMASHPFSLSLGGYQPAQISADVQAVQLSLQAAK